MKSIKTFTACVVAVCGLLLATAEVEPGTGLLLEMSVRACGVAAFAAVAVIASRKTRDGG